MHDIGNFTLADMARCAGVLRTLGRDASSMEEAAGRVVSHLYDGLIDGASGERAFVLLRFFKTHPYADLGLELRAAAESCMGRVPEPSAPCLTLLATRGRREEWSSRRRSGGHKAIPLHDERTIAGIPMIASLFKQFGVSASDVVGAGVQTGFERGGKPFDVFHVAEALGSPAIPAQDFVREEGVRSCIGFGGLLHSGALFAVIGFSRAPIPIPTAAMFKTLAVATKAAVVPYEDRVFAAEPGAA